MSLLAPLTIAALVAAVVAALLPDVARRRTPGSLATWPAAVATVFATVGLASALATDDDIAGAALMLLVVALTAVVQTYASRTLRGDPRSRGFFALSSLAAVGSVTAIAADDVVLLAAGWTVGTVSTIALVSTGGAGPQTRVAVSRSAVALLAGDAALWAATVVAVALTGSTSLAALATLDPGAAATVSVLVAGAAVARAGSFPLHGWLPATAAASTPVSALLHAGFVNAGALLLLRTASVPSAVGPWVVAAAGAITMIIATLAMLTRPDVKGRLVHSTAAQMGFLLLACGLGAFGVALVHAIGHALFKASLFLGAGSAVEHAVKLRASARSTRSARGAILGAAAVLVTGAVTLVASGAADHGAAVLLLFAGATATTAGARIGGSGSPVGARAALLTGLVALTAAYIAVVFPAAEELVPAKAADPAPAAVAAVVFVIAAASALAARQSGRIGDRLFALAFSWGRPPLPPTPPRIDTSWTPAPVDGPLEYRRF
ncbi:MULTISPECIES: proton-conducting transporter membrane subunit [Microbacterium]|uniref:proton-conducting transporter transmembrane domain-containing protein n=1 Tax=Microbacterium TaxID=33882 RepID=UPI002784CB8B|nr:MULTISPECIES: proton-conducting transporter membrane subunit [Microbacterium]MDQ1082464.1 NAD(P)H-quinone oxidoreductase subunit 5 [Microbacterium sp. SORGH_AS_0344]MDQ1168764.1 NAD(P)H-quinone oxidoreductase subunit 5 [Microbacterium proteolyticum]